MLEVVCSFGFQREGFMGHTYVHWDVHRGHEKRVFDSKCFWKTMGSNISLYLFSWIISGNWCFVEYTSKNAELYSLTLSIAIDLARVLWFCSNGIVE